MPVESEAQRRAMEAAAHGRSTLGIPEKVGKEFLRAPHARHLPEHVKRIAHGMKTVPKRAE